MDRYYVTNGPNGSKWTELSNQRRHSEECEILFFFSNSASRKSCQIQHSLSCLASENENPVGEIRGRIVGDLELSKSRLTFVFETKTCVFGFRVFFWDLQVVRSIVWNSLTKQSDCSRFFESTIVFFFVPSSLRS